MLKQAVLLLLGPLGALAASPPHLIFCLVDECAPDVPLNPSSAPPPPPERSSCAAAAAPQSSAAAASLGYNGLGFNKHNDEVKTPTIDALAQGGVILDNH